MKSQNDCSDLTLKNKDSMDIELTSSYPLCQKSTQSPPSSKLEKVNNIKMLEKVSTTSSQKSTQSPPSLTLKKVNNIKMLEKVSTTSSQKSTQSPPSLTLEKKLEKRIKTKKNIKNNNNANTIYINNLLSKLTDHKNISQLKDNTVKQVQKNNSLNNNAHSFSKEKSNEINIYKQMLIQSISENFYSDPSYSGKQCILYVNLLSDGTLKYIKSSNNYSPLCQSAISAVKLVKLPPPSNLEIYQIFKDITLNFSP